MYEVYMNFGNTVISLMTKITFKKKTWHTSMEKKFISDTAAPFSTPGHSMAAGLLVWLKHLPAQ